MIGEGARSKKGNCVLVNYIPTVYLSSGLEKEMGDDVVCCAEERVVQVLRCTFQLRVRRITGLYVVIWSAVAVFYSVYST